MKHFSKLSALGLLGVALTIGGSLLLGPSTAQSDDPVIRAQQLLLERSAADGFRLDLSDLRLLTVRLGLSAEHVRYQQTVNGLPVFGAYVSVSLPKDRQVAPLLVSRYVADLRSNTSVPALTSAEALAIALGQIGADSSDLQSPASSELVYYAAGKRGYVLAWQVVAPTLNPLGSWLVFVDAASGEVLYKHDLIRFDSGRVFDPNPAKTNGGTAAATDCDTPGNEALLAPQYRTKDLLGIDMGQNRLKGAYADVTAPGIPPGYKPAGQANEATRNYVYACSDDRFEEVMAYYHVDATQRKLQSLGFTGQSAVYDSPAPIHAHWFADCNAFFHPISRGLHFGDSSGCPFATDLAEDADVIVHEYGHALQDEQIPGWSFGPYPLAEQAASMGEGFSDFLAGVISGDPCLGEYANFGDSACGGLPGLRWLQNPRNYPAGFEACLDVDFDGDGFPESEEPHCGGEVWGGALWDLVESLPGGVNQANRDLALTLVMDAQFYLDPVATFNEAAAAVCLADNALYAGAHVSVITAAFAGRGITTAPCAASDFPYLYLRILHTFAGDLDINVKVGTNVNAPVCQFMILDGPVGIPGPFIGYGSLTTPADCASHLPPATAQPWWLEVRDQAALDIGSIENFEISLAGGTRCVAADMPVFIPDNDGFVYSKVDCTNQSGPMGSTSPTPTPGPTGPGSITIVKDAIPNDPEDFQFSGDWEPGGVNFSLDDDADGTLPNSRTFSGVSPGLHIVTESPIPSGWFVSAIVCSDGSNVDLQNATAIVNLQGGEHVTCTFTNELTSTLGSITIVKDAIPNDPQDFQFSGDWEPGGVNFSLDDDGDGTLPNSRTFSGVRPGLHIATESPIPSGWFVSGIVCSDGSNVDLQNATAIVNLQTGEHVTCTFTNELTSTLGSITIVKDAIPNDPQDFRFSGDWEPGGVIFNLDDDGDGTLPNSRTFSGVRPGLHIVTETPIPSGWVVSGIVCNDGSNVDLQNATAIVNLQSGEHVTCTFTNQRTTAAGSYYHPVTPCRILDTRFGPEGKVGDNSEITVDVTGSCDVPGAGVSAVVINTTVTEPTAGSYLTVYPSDVSPRPTASNLNFGPGQTVANLVTVKVGADGDVKVYNAVGQVHVIFDVAGWYGGPTGGSRFNGLSPQRIVDTRTSGQGKLPPGFELVVRVTIGGITPTALVLNATVTEPTANSYLTFYRCGTVRPTASNLNFGPGQTVPNLVIVPVGPDGCFRVYNEAGATHVILDLVGVYGATGDLFYPLPPCIPSGKVGHNSEITVDVTEVTGVPCQTPPSNASAVVMNTTVTEPTAGSYLTVYPSDVSPPPTASNLNFGPGQTVPNLVTVKVGADGNVKVYNAVGQVHVIMDTAGYFAQ